MARAGTCMAVAAAALTAAGCAPATMYHWYGYDDALYRHYRNPQDREAFVEALRTTVRDADERGLRVPPGLSAELGYALYEEGRTQDAIPWFDRERQQWPESRVLMEKMIRNAELRGARRPPGAAPSVGPAGATQGGRHEPHASRGSPRSPRWRDASRRRRTTRSSSPRRSGPS